MTTVVTTVVYLRLTEDLTTLQNVSSSFNSSNILLLFCQSIFVFDAPTLPGSVDSSAEFGEQLLFFWFCFFRSTSRPAVKKNLQIL